jgi:3-mercaptopyruvate sulfurtransferase SseA
MKRDRLIILVFFLMTLLGCKTFSLSAEVSRMTKEELKAILGKPDLIIIDVRAGSDWTGSDLKIKGAVREDPENIGSWANNYSKNKTLVFY